jgi:prepilin-type N-terminal cleavage/methylation domain-containing protein
MPTKCAPSCCPPTRPSNEAQRGFSLLEVMFSMVILVIGIVGLLSLFALALTTMSAAQDDLIAKQSAVESLEGIYSARNTGQLSFAQINNTNVCTTGTPVVCGVFLTGWQQLKDPGTDGIEGTADDGAVLVLTLPGPSGSLASTATDKIIRPLTYFQRQITITPYFSSGSSTADPDIVNVQVTVQYQTGQLGVRSYSISGLVSRYR